MAIFDVGSLLKTLKQKGYITIHRMFLVPFSIHGFRAGDWNVKFLDRASDGNTCILHGDMLL